ncbi:MAG TPA: hypothetical protein VHB68_01375 [Steroidobacteraceae bacterium]|nr:hypothetical protein [Steroidobacteraceae bacterium]
MRKMPGPFAGIAVLTLSAQLVPTAHSQTGAPPPVIEIQECRVYPPGNPHSGIDCTRAAKAACEGKPACEFPIGSRLSGHPDADSEPFSWKKVRVRFRCGKLQHVSGPFDQDDHATMQLSCFG